MPNAQLIVCERANQWVIALRMIMGNNGRSIAELNRLEECGDALSKSPASLLALELTQDTIDIMASLLVGLRRSYPHSRAIVFASRDLAPYQWLMREAGAVHVCLSPRNLTPVVRLIERHFVTTRQPQRNFRQDTWHKLPWSDDADEKGG